MGQAHPVRAPWNRLRNASTGCNVFPSRSYLLSKRKKWPEFVHVASYWVSIATSSIAAERVFGIMRAIMQDNRGAADPETWARELMLRCNETVLSAMLEEALEEFVSKW